MEQALANDKKFNLAFQKNLLLLIKEHNMSQAQLAKAVDLHTSTISKYVKQQGKGPSAYGAVRIAQFFNVSLQWMGGLTHERAFFQQSDIPAEYFSISAQGQKLINQYIIQYHNQEQTNSFPPQAAEESQPYQAEARGVQDIDLTLPPSSSNPETSLNWAELVKELEQENQTLRNENAKILQKLQLLEEEAALFSARRKKSSKNSIKKET